MAGAMRVNGWSELVEEQSWKLDKAKYHCLIHFTSLLSHFLRIWNNATLTSLELTTSIP